jgi:putative phosphoribosyl transferase
MASSATSTRRAARPVQVAIGPHALAGDLAVPEHAHGFVMFAHGSGSSRFSPRNRYVADVLHQNDLATLLIDLLTRQEEAIDDVTGRIRFDIGLLANRLVALRDWAQTVAELRDLQIGLFGASTGGGAALLAAAERPHDFHGVVSRGGRPDLAGPALARALAPTLLIVGERDEMVIELNRRAMAQMRAEVRLEIVPRATHLFEEPGALEQVARLAADWFTSHLGRTG